MALAESLQPDVILMDVNMPGLNGIEATRRALEVSPAIRVLIITMFEDGASVFAAMRAGARGYLLISISPRSLQLTLEASSLQACCVAKTSLRRVGITC